MFRYGLRGQLVLNLGIVLFLCVLLFGLFVTNLNQLRFATERQRVMNSLSELLEDSLRAQLEEQKVLPSKRSQEQLRSLRSRPWMRLKSALMLRANGETWFQFGAIPLAQRQHLHRWMRFSESGNSIVDWQQGRTEGLVVWERTSVFYSGSKLIGAVWLRWDPAAMGDEFFSSQGLLLLYLSLFGLLVLLILLAFFERRLVRPLSRLGNAIYSLVLGGESEGLEREVVRDDEIGDLARIFLEVEKKLLSQSAEREGSILELKEANSILERAQQELVLREKMASVGHLAAGVAHEVGNPLSAIMGYSDLLQTSSRLGEMDKDLAKRIHKETKRIDLIIRDLLEYARPISEEEPGQPHQAVLECLELLKLQQRFKGMEVTTFLDEFLPHVTLASGRLVQILLNLLLNAADACAEGGKVILKTERTDENTVVIVVIDNGSGVPSEVIPRLFEPFFTTKAPGKGVGLGLALCQSLLLNMGGNIEYVDGSKILTENWPLHDEENLALNDEEELPFDEEELPFDEEESFSQRADGLPFSCKQAGAAFRLTLPIVGVKK